MPSSVSSDSATSLVLRLKRNDVVAWQELVEIYAPLIFHWCRRFRLGPADSADVMQEVFAAVAKSIPEYRQRPTGTLRGWLWTITQNKVRDLSRKNNQQFPAAGGTEAQIQLNEMADPLADVSEESYTSQSEAKQFLNRALALIQTDFQPQTWQAFWNSTIEGQDTASIAQELGISTNSVRQAKSRVLRRLREQLGDQ
jgi:RNA polymerase sigma-70 factor (ECF subfamily)